MCRSRMCVTSACDLRVVLSVPDCAHAPGSTLIYPLQGLSFSSHSLHFSVEIHPNTPTLVTTSESLYVTQGETQVPESIRKCSFHASWDKACGSAMDRAPCLTLSGYL